MLKRWLDRQKVHAIHTRDLEKILEDLGIIEEVRSGRARCLKCGKVLTLKNIQCVLMEDSKIKFCCNDLSCYEKVTLNRKENNK